MSDCEALRAAVLTTAIKLAEALRPEWLERNEIEPAGRVAFSDGVRFSLAILLEAMIANGISAQEQLTLAITLRKEIDNG